MVTWAVELLHSTLGPIHNSANLKSRNTLFAILSLSSGYALFEHLYDPTNGIFQFSFLSLTALSVYLTSLIAILFYRHPSQRWLLCYFAPINFILLICLSTFREIEHWVLPDTFLLASHIVLSSIAWVLITLASIQAAILKISIMALKGKKLTEFSQSLPSLEALYNHLFTLLKLTWLLLLASLITAAPYIENLLQQKIAHKAFFTSISWLCLSYLLWSHHRDSWNHAKAIRYTLVASSSLIIGYFGSNLVLAFVMK